MSKLLDQALAGARTLLKRTGVRLLSTPQELDASISYHLQRVRNWSRDISFKELKQPKSTTDVFIDLDLYVLPRRFRVQQSEAIERIPLTSIFECSSDHIILVGQPGAGKSTSMKYLCQGLFLDKTHYDQALSFPIVVQFRDLTSRANESSIIIDHVYDLLGLNLDFTKLRSQSGEKKQLLREQLVLTILDELGVLLILDGFDEFSEYGRRDDIAKEISTIASHLDRARMIVTSRTGEFTYHFDNTTEYEVCNLNMEQIADFAGRWLRNSAQTAVFLKQVRDSPFSDTTIRPLTLAHLCAIFERVGEIPDRPRTVYRKVVNLLLEKWDQEKAVKRRSRYAHWEVDRKFEFLAHLAYELTTAHNKTVFPREELLQVYRTIHADYDLLANEAQRVVDELESHTGLFLQLSHDDFEFAHKSLQEYLTAEHLVRLPTITTELESLLRLPNELAIAVSISSKPSHYLIELVASRLSNRHHTVSEEFIKSFLSRLVLERPDFNVCPYLDIAFFMLNSRYIEHAAVWGSETAKQKYVITDEFEKLLHMIMPKVSPPLIKNKYVVAKEILLHQKHVVLRLQRKRNAGTQPRPMPETLFVTKSLFESVPA